MVQINPILAQEGINPGSVPSTARDTSVGRAVEGFGASIGQLGAVLQEHKNAVDRFNTNQQFQRFQSDNALSFSKQQENIDPSGQGLTKSVIQDYDQRSKQFLSLVPDGLKPQYSQLVATAKEQWLNKASAAELDQRNDWYRTGITKTTTGLQNQVFDDPSHYQGALDDGNRTIDASGLPPVEKQKLKDAWKETLATTLGQREARDALNDPSSANGSADRLGIGPVHQMPHDVQSRAAVATAYFQSQGYTPEQAAGIVGNLIGESQLNSGAVGDHGISVGIAQWNGERLNELKRFAAANGKDYHDFQTQLAFVNLELKNDESTAGNAIRSAKTVEDATKAAIGYERPQGWTADNPTAGNGYGRRLAAAQHLAGVEVTGSSKPVPQYADLPLAKRLEIYDNIQASSKKGLSAIQAQQKTAYDSQMGQMKLGIETGQVNSPQTIMGASWMKDGDKATLLHQLNEQLKTNGAISAHIAAVSAGSNTAKVNPFDSQDRSLDNKAFSQVMKTVPEEQVQPVAENWVKTTGNIPDQFAASIRQDLSSQNVANVAQGMAEASKLYQIASSAFDAIPNGADLKKAALAYNQYVYDRGLSDQEAGTRWMNANSPEAIQQREQLKKPAADFVKTLSITDVTSALNSGVPILGRPNAGLTPEQQAAVMSDYTKIANEDFLKAGGDPDLAKTLALADMKKLYGVSDVSGSKTIMKFPPENYYPQVNGGFGYIRDAAMQQALADHPDAQNVMLRPSKETADDIKTNHPPRYQLWYQRPDGTWDQDAAKPLFNVNPDWINGTLGKQRDQRIQKAQELHDAATAYQSRPPQTVDTTSQATMSNSALTNAVNAWAPVPGMKQPTPEPAAPRKAVPPAAPSDAARTNATMMNFMNGWSGSAPLQQEQSLEKSGAQF